MHDNKKINPLLTVFPQNLIFFTLFVILDIATTKQGLQQGYTELNPLLQNATIETIALIKLSIFGIILILTTIKNNPKILWILNIISLIVIINNLRVLYF